MSFDTLGDMFCMISNANHKFHERVDVPASGLKKEVARVLKEEGFIADFKILPDRRQNILRIFLRYLPDKKRVIAGVKRVSRPGLRVYKGGQEIPKVKGAMGISIVSTSKGVKTAKQCRKDKVGGEVLGFVW